MLSTFAPVKVPAIAWQLSWKASVRSLKGKMIVRAYLRFQQRRSETTLWRGLAGLGSGRERGWWDVLEEEDVDRNIVVSWASAGSLGRRRMTHY